MQAKEAIDQAIMKRALTQITYETIERNHSIQDIMLVGIKTWGIYIASRIAERLKQLRDIDIPVGELDVTLYRDDEKESPEGPELHSFDILVSLEGKKVILIDDVSYTGQMIWVAMDAVMGFGRPRKISLAVLVGCGRWELSIHADYVGKSIPTSRVEEISVEMQELDGQDCIMILEEGDWRREKRVGEKRVSQ